MNPSDELAALWYHLEEWCATVKPTSCYVCSGIEELVPPEMLIFACRSCFPKMFEFKFLDEEFLNEELPGS